jgi:hypothetical protein
MTGGSHSKNRNLTAEAPRAQRSDCDSFASERYLVQSQSNRAQSESSSEGMNLVIQSPLTIGSQKNISQRPLRLRGESGLGRDGHPSELAMESQGEERNK